MKKTIKTRMILNGILSVMVSISLAMVIVFFLLKNQNQAAAAKRIDQAAQVVSVQYKAVEKRLLSVGGKISTNEFIGEQFQFIIDTLDVDQSIEFILLQICDYIFEQAQVNYAASLRLYDIEGKWINGVTIHNNIGRLMFPDLPGSGKYKENNVPVGEFANAQNWRNGTSPLPIPATIPAPVPSKTTVRYLVIDQKVWIEVASPIFSPAEKTRQVGVALISAVIEKEFIEMVSEFTSTRVNLFIDSKLSVGALSDYQTLTLEKEGSPFTKTDLLGIDIAQKVVRETRLAGRKYFESVYPVIGEDSVLGAFSILISQDETQKNLNQMMKYLLAIALACLLGVTPLTWIFANSIVKPIKIVVEGMRDIAEGEGDLTVRFDVHTEDEVGELSRWFNTFADKLQGIIRAISENAEVLHASSTDLAALSGEMSKSAYRMLSRAQNVSGMSDDMNANMSSVSVTMEEASANMGTISNSTEQLSAVLNEVASNSEKARGVTGTAVSQARDASNRVEDLGSAAKEIGKVIETITEISEQTNLLALNATIESARAGEAGKGFAVVANEIKELARQTAAATLEIKQQIEDIQKTSKRTTNDIKQISDVIQDVSEIVTTIASSVEEQSISTKEIAQNVQQASDGIADVTEKITNNSTISNNINTNINMVSDSSNDISTSSDKVDQNAKDLSLLSDKLKTLVNLFKV